MKLTRRNLIKSIAYGTCGSLVHSASNSFVGGNNAWAVGGITNELILILVYLDGGASYNMTPIYDGVFRDINPSISFGPESSIPLTNTQGLHPSLKGFKSIYDSGELALLNLVEYSDLSQSHADSRDIWFRGVRNVTNPSLSEGWAARLSCELGNLFAGVSLGSESDLILSGSCSNTPKNIGSIDTVGEYPFIYPELGVQIQKLRADLVSKSTGYNNESYDYLKKQHEDLLILEEKIKPKKNLTLTSIDKLFPDKSDSKSTKFVNACRDAATLLSDNSLGIRFVYLSKDGFDTHSGESASLKEKLDEVNTGITSLSLALKALGLWNKSLIVTMSEFSRTFENNSGGTDHGHAGPMLIMGGGVAGGIKNPPPSSGIIQKAKNGDNFFRDYDIDFRSVFIEIVKKMNLNSDKIFPERVSFTPLSLFK
jgi:uncharacterized protein (DUF1501 family)